MSDVLKAWGPAEKQAWLSEQSIQRSYANDVVARLEALPVGHLVLEQYGALTQDPKRYPLLRVVPAAWNDKNPSIIITGGVHGYEPSGIMAPLQFLEQNAEQLAHRFNIVVYPCVSPFAFEINHRWNAKAEDPNRHFKADGTAEESLAVMKSVVSLKRRFNVAVDLHETNYRDVQLEKDRCARDGLPPEKALQNIPEGFYLLVQDAKSQPLGRSVVEAVKRVTPICKDSKFDDYPMSHGLVVVNDVPGLCQAFMSQHADHAMTTEIYPDACSVEEAEAGQLASIQASLDYFLR